MKKLSIVALATMMIIAFGTSMAFADAYQVTASFGVRVTEQGVSERVGSITLAPNEPDGTDIFINGDGVPATDTIPQVITVELLGNATMSRSFDIEYEYDGVNPSVVGTGLDYRVTAVAGQDFFTITILEDSALTETILVGHDEFSALCFNLFGTIYNANDPAQQLVQVSYSDNLSNTYSGDIYVATVKSPSISIGMCGKATPTDILIPDSALGQGETCGPGTGTACILTFTDNAAGALTGDFLFTIGRTTGAKAGVGFSGVTIDKWDSVAGDWDGVDLVTGVDSRLDSTGAATADDVDTAQITVAATLTGPGQYRMQASYEFDTCVATEGMWVIDVLARKVPCGGSWSSTNRDYVMFYTPSGTPTNAVFPYAASTAGGFFNGIVFTNPSATAVTIDCTIVEADGDTYTGQVVVAGNEMAVGFVDGLLSPTTTGSDAAFGDESYAIYASGDGMFYGFLFIGDGTQAQGYLPIYPALP